HVGGAAHRLRVPRARTRIFSDAAVGARTPDFAAVRAARLARLCLGEGGYARPTSCPHSEWSARACCWRGGALPRWSGDRPGGALPALFRVTLDVSDFGCSQG